MSLNKVLLMGNLTRDPELRATPSGAKVCNFSVATNYSMKDASGNRKDIPEYHNIVVWGVQAENCHKYLKKGSAAFIEGRIQTRSWDGQDGKKQYKTEVVAENVRFMSSPNRDNSNSSYDSGTKSSSAPQKQEESPKQEEFDIIDFGEDPNPDDIPF